MGALMKQTVQSLGTRGGGNRDMAQGGAPDADQRRTGACGSGERDRMKQWLVASGRLRLVQLAGACLALADRSGH